MYPPRPIYEFDNQFFPNQYFPLAHLFKRSKGVDWSQSQDTYCTDGFYGQGDFRGTPVLDSEGCADGHTSYGAHKLDGVVSCSLEISQNHDFWDRYLNIDITYPENLETTATFTLAVEKFFDEIENLLSTKITIDGEPVHIKIDHNDVDTKLLWRNYAAH